MDYITKLKKIANASGLSRQLLADEIHTSTKTLASWLAGKSTPTRKSLRIKIDELYNKYSQDNTKKLPRDRVRYYGLGDFGALSYLNSIVDLLENFNERSDRDINDILELHNVCIYINNTTFLKNFEQGRADSFIKLKPKIFKMISTFFNEITEENILEII